MLDVLNLALPFFGLIFLGYACGRWKQIPDTGLAWMNFFLIYVALPALFYRILALTPLDEINNPRFIVAATLTTALVFALSALIGFTLRGNLSAATIAGLAGSYGNIGYMGPGLALATLGASATVPVALIFCFETLLLFTLVPLLMALAGTERKSLAVTLFGVVKQVVLHPFIIATALGVASAIPRRHVLLDAHRYNRRLLPSFPTAPPTAVQICAPTRPASTTCTPNRSARLLTTTRHPQHPGNKKSRSETIGPRRSRR